MMETKEVKAQEEGLTEKEILQEIVPIFREFFIAKFHRTQEGVSMKLPNGQRFYIRVEKA